MSQLPKDQLDGRTFFELAMLSEEGRRLGIDASSRVTEGEHVSPVELNMTRGDGESGWPEAFLPPLTRGDHMVRFRSPSGSGSRATTLRLGATRVSGRWAGLPGRGPTTAAKERRV